jgi:hypothetical protein
MSRPFLCLFGLIWMVSSLLGCRSAASISRPEDLLNRYLKTVEDDDPKSAWTLLGEKVQGEMTESEFIRGWREFRLEIRERAKLVKEKLKGPIGISAKLLYPSGLEVDLTWSHGWKIQKNLFVPCRTPQEAITVILAAAEQRNLPALMRLLSKSTRDSIEQLIRDRIEKLKKANGQEIEVNGNRARLQLDARSKIELIFEDGQWRILEID